MHNTEMVGFGAMLTEGAGLPGGAGAAASRPSPSPHVPQPQLPLALASVGLQGSQLVSSLPHNQPKSC